VRGFAKIQQFRELKGDRNALLNYV
jgi:hypothetical protein